MRLEALPPSIVGPFDFWTMGADILVQVDGLRDASSGATISDATVALTLYDAAGTSVATATLTAVSGFPGRYHGTFEPTLIEGQQYTAVITTTKDTNTARWRMTRVAKYARA